MKDRETNSPAQIENRVVEMVDMVHALASFDFTFKLDTPASDAPSDLLAYGLNMLSEEVEKTVNKIDELEEINHNLENYSYTLAHDIKSPLNKAQGIIDLMEDEIEGQDMPVLAEYLSLLKTINESTREMVQGILEYSKITANKRKAEEINLHVLCSQILPELHGHGNIKTEFEFESPVVHYNPTALKQVLSNLMNNAIKFNDKNECQITIRSVEREHDHLISVSDNGPGIPEQLKPNIFNLFFHFNQGKKASSSGLGLAIIKKIILENNGRIWADSQEGRGTTFYFTIKKAITVPSLSVNGSSH